MGSADDIESCIFGVGLARFEGTAREYIETLVASGMIDEFEPVGSRVTCDPPPVDTDEDWLCLTHDPGNCNDSFRLAGFEKGGSEIMSEDEMHDPPVFGSYRRGESNIILTPDRDFYRRFLAASSVAKRLNLLDKADRVALFQAVLYGNPCEASQ